jgi:hypothetical protein
MRKLVFILIAFIAAANFIRAFDYTEAASGFAGGRNFDTYSQGGDISADLPGAENETN